MKPFRYEKSGQNVLEQMSEQDLNRSLVISQLFLLILGLILSKILFLDTKWFLSMIKWNWTEVFLWGTGTGFLIAGIQIFLSKVVPKQWLEDDGLNMRLFQYKTTFSIFWITLCVACIEEFLFRGVLQTKFGFWVAALLFILVHTRYLKKIVLLGILIFVSVLLGLLFAWTQNLWAVIFAHFIIDFVLILYMKKREYKEGL